MNVEIGPAKKEGPPGFTTAEKVVLCIIGGLVAVGLLATAWLSSVSGQGHPL